MNELTQFGRYRLIERLGAGAMGSVYRAQDDSLGREVAVKTIHTAGRPAFQVEMFRARFENEARALAALSHPHVVNVFDVGVQDDTPYLVMELVEGRSLADRLDQEGPLAPEQVRALGAQVARALAAAHARGIVHRDIKPSNVLEAEPGHWKLADFGVAHLPDSSLTLTGQFLGSPAYAAPEALGEGSLGPTSDVYSLGATLYEALAGEPPFGKGGLLTVGALANNAAPRPLSGFRADVPAPIGRAVMDAVARDPARRPGAAELADRLEGRGPEFGAAATAPAIPPPIAGSGPRTGLIVGAAAAILVVGIALGVGLSSDDEPAGPHPNAEPGPSAAPDRPFPELPESEPLSERDAEKNARDWRKVEQKIRQGKEGHALRHLDEILERDPGDHEARALYRHISGEAWGEREDERGRHKKHKKHRGPPHEEDHDD